MITITLKLLDSADVINDKILDAYCFYLNKVFKQATVGINRRVGEICAELIKNTDAYSQLLSGDLLGELGVPEVQARLGAILEQIKQSCHVELTMITKAGKSLRGGIVVKMIRSDFLDILGLPEAEYITEKDVTIPWLNWLLTQGDKIIVIGYDVKLNLTAKERHASRTGLGLMRPGSGWRVSPAYSGTVDNNFITKAFDSLAVERLLLKIVEEEITQRL